MDTEAFRNLQVLEEISLQDGSLTQRRLAQKLEVALGLTNLIIRRFVSKGYIKLTGVRPNRLRYLITPKGIQEKSRLTYEYFEYSLHLYRRVREILRDLLSAARREGRSHVVIFGTGEVAEIAYLTVRELGLHLVGIADDGTAGQIFLGMPVVSLAQAAAVPFDCGILSALDDAPDEARRLLELGVAPEKLVGMLRNRDDIRAYVPSPAAAMRHRTGEREHGEP